LAKDLKFTFKNAQIAEAINLSGLKSKLEAKKPADEESQSKEKAQALAKKTAKTTTAKKAKGAVVEPAPVEVKEAPPKIKARAKSVFSEQHAAEQKAKPLEEAPLESTSKLEETFSREIIKTEDGDTPRVKSGEQLRREIFAEEIEELKDAATAKPARKGLTEEIQVKKAPPPQNVPEPLPEPQKREIQRKPLLPSIQQTNAPFRSGELRPAAKEKLGPTGRHVKDLLPTQKPEVRPREALPSHRGPPRPTHTGRPIPAEPPNEEKARERHRGPKEHVEAAVETETKSKFKEFRDIKPIKKQEPSRFDARDRQGLSDEDDKQWRRRRAKAAKIKHEDTTIRPTQLKVRIPISIKDLASEMKLKASQLIGKLFLQGVIMTLNDLLDDETTIQLLGQEFGCEIEIDHSEQERIRITDKTIREEVGSTDSAQLKTRPPVVAFMGHVDHGKTSLIDAIRKSNRAAGEAGAITQHIGAFMCSTPVGDIAILDTPGHEAFSAMRSRGADVTDIVVLVIAGDEGIKQQTIEAMQHAKAAKVTIVVALNKCDKPNFNAENVYRQLSEHELLPETWGGQTITINCSATTGQGIDQLLEMLALQAEVLELKADPAVRARGSVLESEMHKGLGPVATVLVQNGTLRIGDAIVFGNMWGRVKTMHDEFRREFKEAGPSAPVEITGLSGMPEAGQEFIVVKSEKEAREIAESRSQETKQTNLMQPKKMSIDTLLQQAAEGTKKVLNLILRADVQGSLEALKTALMKIESTKAQINVIFTGVGEVSESDVQRAVSSKAVIIGFHSQIESHAEALLKPLGVQVRLHKIIYHAVDDAKAILTSMLDKIAIETEKGKAEVKATFKSSQHGVIAGCQVTEGTIARNNQARLKRGEEIIWKGSISSLKRVKEDVREVSKGMECGILLNNYTDVLAGDIIEAYDVTYISQEL